MKWIIYVLCVIAICTITALLNCISEGNLSGVGLGDFITKLAGYYYLSEILRKEIWKGEKEE